MKHHISIPCWYLRFLGPNKGPPSVIYHAPSKRVWVWCLRLRCIISGSKGTAHYKTRSLQLLSSCPARSSSSDIRAPELENYKLMQLVHFISFWPQFFAVRVSKQAQTFSQTWRHWTMSPSLERHTDHKWVYFSALKIHQALFGLAASPHSLTVRTELELLSLITKDPQNDHVTGRTAAEGTIRLHGHDTDGVSPISPPCRIRGADLAWGGGRGQCRHAARQQSGNLRIESE